MGVVGLVRVSPSVAITYNENEPLIGSVFSNV